VTRAAVRVGHASLAVIDLQVPTAPRLEAQLEIVTAGDPAVPLAVVGRDVVLLAGSAGGVVIVDVGEPSRPVVSGTYALPSSAYASDIAVDREHIYVGAGEDGLLIFRRPPPRRSTSTLRLIRPIGDYRRRLPTVAGAVAGHAERVQ
jgi:hypothetical protein